MNQPRQEPAIFYAGLLGQKTIFYRPIKQMRAYSE